MNLNLQKKSPKKVIVVRNDKLGDFILCLPSLHLLKKSHPQCKVIMLVSEITYEIATHLPHLIDDVILDVGKKANKKQILEMTEQIRNINADASISLFSTFHIAKCLFKAEIPLRYAPKTKIAQVFYNRKITQRRSQSIQSEYGYNMELVSFFLEDFPAENRDFELKPPFLEFDTKEVIALKKQFLRKHHIPENHKLVFIHPGDSGSASNLSIQQYIDLANGLIGDNFFLVLSAGPSELELAQALQNGIIKKNHCILFEPSVLRYAKHLQFCDLLICGSTGPLHIAGALNRNTLAFFPRDPTTSMIRWQPINESEKQLLFSPPENKGSKEMSAIDIGQVAIEASKLFLMI